MRNLVMVFGDQLDGDSAAFDGFDPALDAIAMVESRVEATFVPQHRLRLAYFFVAMRRFAKAQRDAGRVVHYAALDDAATRPDFAAQLHHWWQTLRPELLVVVEPGDWRVRDILRRSGLPMDLRIDRHFLCDTRAFAGFIARHPRPILETFYRAMRTRLDILVDDKGKPEGGAWNFDHDNRKAYGRTAPPIPPPLRLPADDADHAVVRLVQREFPDLPGRLDSFDLPASTAQARALLDDFVAHRLPLFGRYQDAMRNGDAFGFHSRLSGPLNLHLITPAEVVRAVLANPAGAPLASVEGFVRQVIGWREFVRGIYWHHMPGYAEHNALDAQLPMPRFYWTGDTDMRCLADAIAHTIDHAYAHHIERLMVLGLFALLLGVRPYAVHEWHMSMFWDAIDWVSLPNTLGMGQYGDGGIMATKPYVASGAYINRMSDHCRHCRYDPAQAIGDAACPFTTLYWDFLDRHRTRLAANPRMGNMMTNLDRKDLPPIRRQAARLRARLAG